jgi:phenylpropionate dioxygenase-like ring-hydroxylating dioxygenase large terminal subunit
MSLSVVQDNSGIASSPRALPAWVYNNADMHRLEMQRILMPSWQIVCHLSDIPHAGDYVTLDIGNESVFAVRDRDGEVRAFHNVCRHRGARIVDERGNCPGAITCPYHGWSYKHDGSLIGLPLKDTFPNLDRSTHGLKPVRVEKALGFVWVCLAGNPPPPGEIWGGLAAELAPYQFDKMVPIAPFYFEVWEADWKIAMDNYLESYHVPIGHPALNRMFTPDFDDTASVPGIARGTSWLRETPSPRWSERMYHSLVRKTVTHLPEKDRGCWRFYSMLPNLGIDVFPEQMDFFQLLPLSPGRCQIRGGIYGLPDDRRDMKLLRWLGARLNMGINAEDRHLCARVQRGLASSSYQPGPLSTLECWMLEFHNLLREKIPEVKLASPPARIA